MFIENIVVGSYEVNCYIIGCDIDNESAVIDPGDNGRRIISIIEERELSVKYIINTHAHGDHIGAVSKIKERYPKAEYMLHKNCMAILNSQATRDMIDFLGLSPPPAPDSLISSEIEFDLCDHIKIKALHVPGHSPGGIALLSGDSIFTGDSLFAGSIGRTDFPLSSHEELICSIKTKIMTLDDSVKIYPGHGESSTIGTERVNNPFL